VPGIAVVCDIAVLHGSPGADAVLSEVSESDRSGPRMRETGPVPGLPAAHSRLARFQAEWRPVGRPESAPDLKSRAHSDVQPVSTFAECAL